jgi:hypothetical protein
MVITNNVPNQITKLILNVDPNLPQYFQLGTADTTPTQGDTALVAGTATVVKTSGGASAGVGFTQVILPSTNNVGNYKEFGISDGTTSTRTFYGRDTSGTTIVHSQTVNTRLTKFTGVGVKNNNAKKAITSDFVNKVSSWFSGDTFTEPTHMAWGTYQIVDTCNTLGTDLNKWENRNDGTPAIINLANVKEGSACISLGKQLTANGTAAYGRTLSTSIDATHADEFWIWFNPVLAADYDKLATTDALELRIGSGTSDYKYKKFDKSDLIVGWQRLKTNISDMTDNDSPDMGAITHLTINLRTEDIASTIPQGSFLMDYWTFRHDMDYDGTTMVDEQVREAVGTVIPKDNRATFKKTLQKTSGNIFNLSNIALFNASSDGDKAFDQEGVEIKKNKQVRIIGNVNIDTKIRD